MAYTYDDFINAAGGAGMLNNFSQYDLDLAKKHPEFGLSILSLKKDYANASTDAQRLLANEAANELRKSYGNYTGGSDGSSYISGGKVPGKVDSLLEQIGSFGKFEYDTPAPSYTNRYADQQAALLEQIVNRGDFTWKKEDDPAWSSYKKQYLREGDRASANALAQASAATGGRPSSFAVMAASQAGDYYGAKLADVIPQLRQNAYNEWQNGYQMLLRDLDAVNQQEQMDYNKYLAELQQHNNDKKMAYDQWLQDYNMLQNQLGAMQGQEKSDYAKYLDQINLQMQQEQVERQQAQNDFANALALYQQYGYVTPEMSGVLGLPAGTPTADQRYTEFQQAQKLAKQTSGTGTGTKTDDGIVETMLSYGDDVRAYEHLLKLGLSQGKTDALWEFYTAQKGNQPQTPIGEDQPTEGGYTMIDGEPYKTALLPSLIEQGIIYVQKRADGDYEYRKNELNRGSGVVY